MHYLRQASGTTAASGPTITIGPCLDSAGAEYTGLVIGDVTLGKNGTEAAMAANATLTHVSNGYYSLVMIGNNADTLGRAKLRCNKSTYQFPPVEYTVLTATAYDALVANGTIASTTSGRTIDVSAGGEVGLDWANIGSPTTTVNFSGTTVKTLTDTVALPTIPNNWLTAAGIASAAFTSGKFAADAIDSNALAASAVTEMQSGLSTLTQSQVSGGAYALNSASFAFNSAHDFTTAQKAATLARVTLVDTATTLTNAPSDSSGTTTLLSRLSSARAGYLDNINNSALASLTNGTIADQVWDEILSGHAVSGSTGEALSAAGGAGDPWITALPGSYTAGQAGYILGTNLDALISSRMATFTLPTGFLAATFPSTVASTTNITAAAGCTVSSIGTDAINSTALAASAVSEIQSGLSTHSASDVWAVTIRLLTAGTNIALAKGTGITGFNDLDALGMRSALGLATANLDTQLAALPTATENATELLGTAMETNVSLAQCIRAIASAAAGKVSNARTANETFDAIGNPGTLRLTTNGSEAGDRNPTLTLGV